METGGALGLVKPVLWLLKARARTWDPREVPPVRRRRRAASTRQARPDAAGRAGVASARGRTRGWKQARSRPGRLRRLGRKGGDDLVKLKKRFSFLNKFHIL
jgi:hypothetical protein